MSFRKDLAELFANDVDRDRAPYFAGRSHEIDRFETRLKTFRTIVQQSGTPSSSMLIYQGAPGCGKTSLVGHLAKRHPDLLFVAVRKLHLASEETLKERIRDAAIKGDLLFKVGGGIAQAVGELLRTGRAGEQVRDYLSDKAAARIPMVVVYFDEAQIVDRHQEEALQSLQMAALPVPVLPVLTGLPHTLSRLTAIPGMSRLSRDAVINMGQMTPDECIESCRIMFDQLSVPESRRTENVCRDIARLSYGWPQHLNRAQTALTLQLLKAGGDLTAVDMTKVEDHADQDRGAYYAARLEGSILGKRPKLVSALVRRLESEQPSDPLDLEDMCAEEIQRFQLMGQEGFNPERYAQAMLERGVLSKDEADRYVVAIPSMAAWLGERYPPNSGRSTARFEKGITDR